MVVELVVEQEQRPVWLFAWSVVEPGWVVGPEEVRMACKADTACFVSTAAETNSKPATVAMTSMMSTSSAVVDDAAAG